MNISPQAVIANSTMTYQVPISPDDLVRQYMPLVKRIARRIFAQMSSSVPIEDLVQIGAIALLEAASVFEDRGVATFSTYASTRIRGAMIDNLRRSATMSRQSLKNRRTFSAATNKLASELGHQPDDTEVAARLGMAVADYRSAASAMQGLRYESIDAAYSDTNSAFADSGPNAFDIVKRDKLRAALAAAVAGLPQRESMVLQLYYVEELGLEEIGAVLDVTAPRVCQIKKAALGKIRRRLAGWQ